MKELFAVAENTIPEHQREMIDWLDSFQNTAKLKHLMATRTYTREDVDRMKEKLRLTLTPKKNAARSWPVQRPHRKRVDEP